MLVAGKGRKKEDQLEDMKRRENTSMEW